MPARDQGEIQSNNEDAANGDTGKVTDRLRILQAVGFPSSNTCEVRKKKHCQ
jgi:hypothetical protein